MYADFILVRSWMMMNCWGFTPCSDNSSLQFVWSQQMHVIRTPLLSSRTAVLRAIFNHLGVYAILTFTHLKFKFADSKSPFLYNPLEAKDKADANNTEKPVALWVAGETATVEIEIWNPTAQTIKAILASADTQLFWIQHLFGLRPNNIDLSSHLSYVMTYCATNMRCLSQAQYIDCHLKIFIDYSYSAASLSTARLGVVCY